MKDDRKAEAERRTTGKQRIESRMKDDRKAERRKQN
jgi:hypothetical protein